MAKYVNNVQVSFEKAKTLSVEVQAGVNSSYAKDAADEINTWFAGAIGTVAANEKEFLTAVSLLQNQINECSDDIKEVLEIHFEDFEFDE